MNISSLKEILSTLGVGEARYFQTIGSTNDEALAWANEGAPDFSLVVADEQTSGRGRLNRKWFTPAGSALAVSLILRPADSFRPYLSRAAGLAALAIAESLRALNLHPQIKWPNDVLLNGKKVAGVLIENIWTGDKIEALVIGMGINVYKNAVPPAGELMFPASSIEDELGKMPPPREEILGSVLQRIFELRSRVDAEELIQSWNELLAFRACQVEIRAGEDVAVTGELLAVDGDGALQVKDEYGRIVSIRYGDVSLRPAA